MRFSILMLLAWALMASGLLGCVVGAIEGVLAVPYFVTADTPPEVKERVMDTCEKRLNRALWCGVVGGGSFFAGCGLCILDWRRRHRMKLQALRIVEESLNLDCSKLQGRVKN